MSSARRKYPSPRPRRREADPELFDAAIVKTWVTMAREKRPCLLCDGPPATANVYAPDATVSAMLGIPPDKVTKYSFTLCRPCASRHDLTGAIREFFLEEARSTARNN